MKVRDRVRIVKGRYILENALIGREGEVTRTYPSSPAALSSADVTLDDGRQRVFYEDEMELLSRKAPPAE